MYQGTTSVVPFRPLKIWALAPAASRSRRCSAFLKQALVFGPAWKIVYVFFGAYLNNALNGFEWHVGKEQHFDHAHRTPPQCPCSLMRCEWHSQNPRGTPVVELLYIWAENGRNITGWEEDILRARTGRDKKSSNFDI